MSKKRKAVLSDDDSDYDDASTSKKKPRKAPSRKKPPAKSKAKTGETADASAYEDEQYLESTEAGDTRRHPASLHVLSSPESPREALLKWYDGVHAARGMPWRKPFQQSWNAEEKAQRAYEVWVSEIMLQQTQVATVIPYYNKWMERFPTIRDLAASDIDTVNGLWKGLGYYSRAARLLSGAQKAVDELGGRLPDNAQDMESKVPGIGRYSAGAICSIAYNQCVPVLDGNVHRLLSRVLALHAPPKAKQTLDVLWAGASAFVKDAERPGDVNQALIELGSTVCKVRDPACGPCPLRPWCVAHEHQGKEDEVGQEPIVLRCVARAENVPCNQGTKDAPSPVGHAVPDIEELCTLCGPLRAGASVTAYPMKAEKKKAREELDVVNVIEWRTSPSASTDGRWFLLVRRPEGGLLAGLHEFPTAPNVPVTSSAPASAHTAIADSLLAALLVSPPPPAAPARRSAAPSDTHTARRPPPRTSANSPNPLRVAKIVPAGDVLHIFSHIRKTYRVQWVVLEGGPADGPPPLVATPDPVALGAALPKSSKAKDKGKSRVTAKQAAAAGASRGSPASQATTQWVREDAVADANIGTGVMKIWRQARALWEAPGDDARSHSDE
ncbi:DNA glycosylase [Trametes meyenii]|nr:DNA glycosylase [Trametes meyenii]